MDEFRTNSSDPPMNSSMIKELCGQGISPIHNESTSSDDNDTDNDRKEFHMSDISYSPMSLARALSIPTAGNYNIGPGQRLCMSAQLSNSCVSSTFTPGQPRNHLSLMQLLSRSQVQSSKADSVIPLQSPSEDKENIEAGKSGHPLGEAHEPPSFMSTSIEGAGDFSFDPDLSISLNRSWMFYNYLKGFLPLIVFR